MIIIKIFFWFYTVSICILGTISISQIVLMFLIDDAEKKISLLFYASILIVATVCLIYLRQLITEDLTPLSKKPRGG
ncbi:MAG: hypothetical protein PF572_06325 [Patescibacteria group bacterium]|jgi:hypothetical protein|nr:hypothetical protein [Patescibacteria group bacterium]